ncbi:MAG: hypothetical protein ACQES1_04785, partial [Bacteroidota bacterium]
QTDPNNGGFPSFSFIFQKIQQNIHYFLSKIEIMEKIMEILFSRIFNLYLQFKRSINLMCF